MEIKVQKCFLISFIIFINASGGLFMICTTGLVTKGYTYPKGDIIIEYGVKPLEIYCVINNEEYLLNHSNPSRYLHFVRDGELQTNVEIVNATAIRLYDEHINVSFYQYHCLLGDEAVCLNRVVVGTKPKPVTDFRCISYNNDNLTCTWTPENNTVQTTYELKYSLPGRAGRKFTSLCPGITTTPEGRKSCVWTVSTNPHYRQSQPFYTFTLTMSNVFGNDVMTTNFDHFKYVKPGPPKNLIAVNTTASSICLYWQIPNTMVSFEPGLQYRILYQCEYGPKDWKLADIQYIKNTEDVYYNLTDLEHAHDLCDIRVSLRSNKSNDEIMWSSNSSITHRTSSAIPGAAPRVNIGSFELVSSAHNITTQDVYIYWQELPEEIKNGEDFHYNVSVSGDPSGIKYEYTNGAYAYFKDLLKFRDYTFVIWSVNDQGESVDKSFVTVPRQERKPRQAARFTKIAHDNGKFELYWQSPDIYNDIIVKNFTIFWCKNNKDRPYQCAGYLNWTEVPSNQEKLEIIVPESNNDVWQFAISVNSENYSSGMVWASCTVLHSKSLGKIRRITKHAFNATSIKLGWSLECLDVIPTIAGFIIYYCPIDDPKLSNCKGPQKNITIDGNSSTTEGLVTGLKPYTAYMLSVAILTKSGDVSEQSDTIHVSTLEGAPSVPMHLNVINVSNSTIEIAWDPPIEINGKLKYYEVTYNDAMILVDPHPRPSKVLENLTSFETYNISVKACTTSCSLPVQVDALTKMGSPGKISQPTVSFQNDSYILVDWNKPNDPRGKNDYYQIKLKEKSVDEDGMLLNVTETKYPITLCGEDGNTQIFVSVRAVNIIENGVKHLYGPWSDDLECLCSTTAYIYIWIFVLLMILLFVPFTFFIKKLSVYCQIMRNVEMKLPPGLTPIPDWSTTKGLEPQECLPSGDEQEILLINVTESTIPSGDSSGCSSGHGSVASDSGTTISSASDSGTEQNQLRKRSRPVPGYITMPTDVINKQRPKPQTAGNYCVLGIDPKKAEPTNYISVAAVQEAPKLPFIPCEVISPPSAYVMTGDITKQANSGYVPLNHPEITDKTPAYVMAGANNLLIDLVKDKKEDNPIYNIARND